MEVGRDFGVVWGWANDKGESPNEKESKEKEEKGADCDEGEFTKNLLNEV